MTRWKQKSGRGQWM